uniref:Secretory leukocyte peptidase inhibitor n=1 Tax=Chrysemys picta bellii TaxID=8478 RepID=A0A8C3HZS6_CHRPI
RDLPGYFPSLILISRCLFILPSSSLAVKSGTCPVVTVRCLMINPPNRCNYDHQCPGPKKCCETGCGRACVLLQRGTGLKKPRTCPVVTVRCRMINPPNRCNSDHQCPGFKKCCETFCGRPCSLLKAQCPPITPW